MRSSRGDGRARGSGSPPRSRVVNRLAFFGGRSFAISTAIQGSATIPTMQMPAQSAAYGTSRPTTSAAMSRQTARIPIITAYLICRLFSCACGLSCASVITTGAGRLPRNLVTACLLAGMAQSFHCDGPPARVGPASARLGPVLLQPEQLQAGLQPFHSDRPDAVSLALQRPALPGEPRPHHVLDDALVQRVRVAAGRVAERAGDAERGVVALGRLRFRGPRPQPF